MHCTSRPAGGPLGPIPSNHALNSPIGHAPRPAGEVGVWPGRVIPCLRFHQCSSCGYLVYIQPRSQGTSAPAVALSLPCCVRARRQLRTTLVVHRYNGSACLLDLRWHFPCCDRPLPQLYNCAYRLVLHIYSPYTSRRTRTLARSALPR